jgi:DNA-binding NtrC family response regulator
VVDDYPSVRKVLGIALERRGFTVFLAGSGEEACEILKEHSVDLVLMDLRMPRMSGPTLFQMILSRWPHLRSRVLVMSGDVEINNDQAWLSIYNLPTIRKPFGMNEIADLIESLMSEGPLEANGP